MGENPGVLRGSKGFATFSRETIPTKALPTIVPHYERKRAHQVLLMCNRALTLLDFNPEY